MSVGHKSTKEKFMKKNLIIMLIVIFTFSLTFIACDNEPDETDPTLNGAWIDKDGTIIKFNNGTFELINDGSSQTGIFTTDGNKITYTTQITECDFFETGHLLSKEAVLEVLKIMAGGDEISEADLQRVNNAFKTETFTATYFINDNKLYLIYEDEEGNVTNLKTYKYTENK
jgi:hypothetical protein